MWVEFVVLKNHFSGIFSTQKPLRVSGIPLGCQKPLVCFCTDTICHQSLIGGFWQNLNLYAFRFAQTGSVEILKAVPICEACQELWAVLEHAQKSLCDFWHVKYNFKLTKGMSLRRSRTGYQKFQKNFSVLPTGNTKIAMQFWCARNCIATSQHVSL